MTGLGPQLRPVLPEPVPVVVVPPVPATLPAQKVALLCPGPSLPERWGEAPHGRFAEYPLVIAVNTSIWHYRAHWLVAVDGHIFKKLWTLPGSSWPLIGCVTNDSRAREAGKRNLKTMHPPLHGKGWARNNLGITAPRGSVQCAYTMPSALWFALQQARGGSVDIYGMDYARVPNDFAGAKGDHSLSRWQREAGWLRAIWQPNITVYGRLSASVLAYLRGETGTLKL